MPKISIYIINTISILVLSVVCKCKCTYGGPDRNKKIEGERIYLWIVCIVFSTIMAFRSLGVGVDTSPYARIYSTIITSSSYFDAMSKVPLEAPVYVLICRIVGVICKNPQGMIAFSAIFVNVGLLKFISKTSSDVPFSIFCWIGLTLFYNSMNGNRQCMALVIILNSLYYITTNIKSPKGWLLMVIAVGIHLTSLMIFIGIAGIIITIKFKKTSLVFLISSIASIIMATLFSAIVKLVIKFFPRYAIYSDGTSRYSVLQSTGGGRIILLYLFLFVICILWLLKVKKENIRIDNFHSKMLPAVIFCAIFGMINCKNELINRMLWVYLAIYITFIPAVLQRYKGTTKLILKIGVVMVLFSYSILSLVENKNGVVPYSVFLNQR